MSNQKMDLSQGRAKEASDIARRLTEQGHIAYFAGGCVRDFLMGKQPQDFDIATSASPDQVEALFPRTVPVGKQFGVILVVDKQNTYYEVATFRREGNYQDGRHPGDVTFSGPEEDALRRDFTVNGMFYDPIRHEVLDYVGGGPDLEKKLIKAIGDPYRRFDEDKLRLLRAVRFASTLNFEIEEATWTALTGEASKISCVSFERIREEITKMILRPGARRGIMLLRDSGLMEAVLPEIAGLAETQNTPDFSPDMNLFEMTAGLVGALQAPSEAAAFAALFYYLEGREPSGENSETVVFSKALRARLAKAADILKRLKASNDVIDGVTEILANQHLFDEAHTMREGVLKRFIARPSFTVELDLYRLHCVHFQKTLDGYEFWVKKIREFEGGDLTPRAYLSGHDLIALGLSPGPKMKPILEEAYLLQLENYFADRDAALRWAKEQVTK